MKRTLMAIALAATLTGTWPVHALAHGGNIPPAQAAAEDKASELQKKLEAVIERSVHLAKQLYGIDDTAIRAPFGRYLLIQAKGKSALLMITEHTRPEPGKPAWAGPSWRGAKYTLLVQADGSNDFSKDNVQSFSGEVHDQKVVGQKIEHAGIKLTWTSGDWIDLPDDGHTSIAASEFIRVADVKFTSTELNWMTRERVASILSGNE